MKSYRTVTIPLACIFTVLGLGLAIARGAGPEWLDRIAERDTDRFRSQDIGRLEVAGAISGGGIDAAAILESLVRSGGSGGGAIAMAAAAERRAEPARGHLWLAIDARSRLMRDLASRREMRAAGNGVDSPSIDELEATLPGYRAWSAWAVLPAWAGGPNERDLKIIEESIRSMTGSPR